MHKRNGEVLKVEIAVNQKKFSKSYMDLISDYKKRLRPYAELSLNMNAKLGEKKKRSYAISINSKAPQISSEMLAEKIENLAIKSAGDLVFYIGFEDSAACDEEFALLAYDASLDILASVLAEQIFRAYTIINGRTYHK